jgi:hypothetical protein
VDELLSINRWTWVEQLFQDARYAIRRLCRDRAFAAAAILTLAIAVGMSTAIFSVFNAVVLRSLDYPTPDRLIWSRFRRLAESGGVLRQDGGVRHRRLHAVIDARSRARPRGDGD